jgi:hypothetical protein
MSFLNSISSAREIIHAIVEEVVLLKSSLMEAKILKIFSLRKDIKRPCTTEKV